MRNCKCSNFRS